MLRAYQADDEPRSQTIDRFDSLGLTKLGTLTTVSNNFDHSERVYLNAGDKIAFGVGNDGSYSYDATGFSLFISRVPEPATWALMIGGFGLTGASMRRRRSSIVAA